jgi:hypothetical protein
MAPWSHLETLRRSVDIAVDLSENGEWCQFDVTTGWPKYTMQEASGPMLESICHIDETSDRGITPRQLLAVYEHVKRHCVTEEWTGRDGKSLASETVTLYDLCKYVIKPATEARAYACVPRACARACVCACACICVRACACMCVRACVCARVRSDVRVRVRSCGPVCACLSVCVNDSARAYVRACACARMCVRAHLLQQRLSYAWLTLGSIG